MVGLGETYLVAYALSLGISEVGASFLSTMPVIVGAFLQFALSYLTQKSKNPQRWLYFCCAGQALSLLVLAFVGIFTSATSEPPSTILLGFIISIYWGLGFTAGPVWNLLIVKIVKPESLKLFFYRRNALNQIAALVSLVLASLILGRINTEQSQAVGLLSFMLILASIARFISMATFFWHPFPKNEPLFERTNKEKFSVWVKKKYIYTALIIVLSTNFAVHISAPFLSPYILKQLKFDLIDYSVLIGCGYLFRVISGYIFNGLVEKSGVRLLLIIGSISVIPIPFLWMQTDSFFWLVVIQLASGIAWGCHELGMTLVIIEKVPFNMRSRLLTWSNLVIAFGMICGVLFAAQFFSSEEIKLENYETIFNLSTLFRIIPFIFVVLMVGNIKGHPLIFRFVGMRSSSRQILKPILIPEPKVKKKKNSSS